MKIGNFMIIGIFLMTLIGCGGGWTAEQEQELLDDCPKRSDMAACKCGVEVIKGEFTYDEYTKLRGMKPGGDNSKDSDLMERALNIEELLEAECGS